WPEEGMRRLTGGIADQHYAPTAGALKNLIMENIPPENIFLTGNSVIDALVSVSNKIEQSSILRKQLESQFDFIDKNKKMILVTLH
ncbi:UDP-N-acetylglucosamine 2-epimerase, partial [Escherichia coli]